MALRKIVTSEDASLYKHCREVTKFDERLHTLLDDMRDTLESADGVGLAAPQVGVWLSEPSRVWPGTEKRSSCT